MGRGVVGRRERDVLGVGERERAFLPARASEQGNVIGLVSVYIYI